MIRLEVKTINDTKQETLEAHKQIEGFLLMHIETNIDPSIYRGNTVAMTYYYLGTKWIMTYPDFLDSADLSGFEGYRVETVEDMGTCLHIHFEHGKTLMVAYPSK